MRVKPLSKLHFTTRLPQPSLFGADTLLIYDRRLGSLVPGFRAWAMGFAATYPVSSGERLKEIREFSTHIERILKITTNLSPRRMTVIVAGGGSVGDFGGFVASVFKRGVPLVHVPTTWLAAIDSAHGGKTALNASGGKNQIGTFYPASDVFLVKSVLLAQPKARVQDACGELAKTAFLDGGSWVAKALRNLRSAPSGEWLWANLKPAIEAKYKVVTQDPREASGVRQILNLGHTMGHVLESHLKLSHGEAVAQGLLFSLAWSFRRGALSLKDYGNARSLLQDKFGFAPLNLDRAFLKRAPSRAQAKGLLLQDKKRAARNEVTFVFLRATGKPYRESVSIDELLNEAQEQGWVR